MSQPNNRPFRNQLDGFWNTFWSQPLSKIPHRLLCQDLTACSLFSYFLEQPTVIESAATSNATESATAYFQTESDRAESDNSKDPSNSQSSNHGENHIFYLPNTLPTPADKEAFFMSSALDNLENNISQSTASGGIGFSANNTVSLPLNYFVPNSCTESLNSEPKVANQEKKALNDNRESSDVHQAIAQLAELAKAQAKQSAEIQQLQATVTAQQVRIDDQQAKISAQANVIADCKGQIQALEEKQRESTLNQSARMDSFEQTYRTDKIQTSRIQQASNQQLEAHLKEMVDAMLNTAVEKAIRLFKRDSNPKPKPARQPSTPNLDHLYETKIYRQKRAS